MTTQAERKEDRQTEWLPWELDAEIREMVEEIAAIEVEEATLLDLLHAYSFSEPNRRPVRVAIRGHRAYGYVWMGSGKSAERTEWSMTEEEVEEIMQKPSRRAI